MGRQRLQRVEESTDQEWLGESTVSTGGGGAKMSNHLGMRNVRTAKQSQEVR